MTRRELERVLRGRMRSDRLLATLRELAVREEASVYLVGGYVRDAVLRRRSPDVDLLCVRGTPRLVRALQNEWGTRGFRFRKRGVTTWRLAAKGRRVDLVDAARRGLLADLRRREATLNAIAFDLVRGRVEDPLRGLADLRAWRLRAPREGVLREDPVRALRAARFLAQFPALKPVRALEVEARQVARGLRRASVERVRDELNRLLESAAPRRGLDFLDRLVLVHALLPELDPLRHAPAGRGRPDVWTHTLDAIERSQLPARLPGAPAARDPLSRRLLRWALLLHDLAKPATLVAASDGRPTFHGHENLGAKRADALLSRLRLPRSERRRVCDLIRLHLRPGHLADSGASQRGLRRLVRDAGDDLALLVLHAACDARASGGPDAAQRWRGLRAVLLRLLEVERAARQQPRSPLLGGHDLLRELGMRPGPEVGRLLAHLREAQDAGEIATRAEALAAARAWVEAKSPS